METKVSYITKEGMDKLLEELDRLQNIERPKISKAIGEAIEKGDISENAEYDAAKEAQGMLEMKIAQMKETLANARIIDESKLKTDSVQILNTVRVKNLANKQEMTYTLVSENEANIREGKLAINTPIGKGLLGKKIGEVAEINVPAGLMRFEVVSISL